MRLRKFIFKACIIVSSILFIQGAFSLNSLVQEDTGYYNDHVPLQKMRNRPKVTGIEQSVNLMVLGLDDEEIRSDVIAILNFNPYAKKINVLSIARDTRVKVNGKYGKINALIAKGGEKLVAEKIEEVTGLKVDYYVTLNFKGFREIVDLVGGVEVDVPMDMDYDDPVQKLHIHLKKGRQILDGDKAEEFVRYRKGNHKGEGYEDGDIGRIEAQQLFLKQFINQKLKPKYILKAGNVLSILKENMKTNIEIGDINFFIREINNIKLNDIKTYTIPGGSVYKDGVWYYIHDEEKTAELIEENFFLPIVE